MTARQSNIILLGIVAAILLAFASVALLGERMTAVAWMGDFFLTALKMVVVPLVLCSIIVGISGLGDIRRVGRVGVATLIYFGLTTSGAVLLGLILVNIFRPGVGLAAQAGEAATVRSLVDVAAAQERFKASLAFDETGDAQGEYGFLGDLLAGGGPLARDGWTQPDPSAPAVWHKGRHRFQAVLPGREPGNVATGDRRAPGDPRVGAVRAQNAWAVVAWPAEPDGSGSHVFYVNQAGEPWLLPDGWDGRGSAALFRPGAKLPSGVALDRKRRESIEAKRAMRVTDIVLSFVSTNIIKALAEMDVLPIIVFGLLFGALLTTIGDKGRPVIEFFDGANEAIMKLVALIMWIAPLGIFGLVAAKFGESKDLGAELARIGWYITTVLVGLAIHGGVVLPTLLWVFGRRNPLQFAVGMGKALLTAFSTASSSATLPLTIECAIDANRVSKRAVLFVVPIGATVNMNGTALYESVAAMFIAQAYGIPLGLGDQALIFVTATLAAVGAAGIPEAGLFTMVLVLKAVGLPLEGIALLLVVDWFLDRCRTTVNVWEDGIAAAIIDRMTGVGAEEPDLDAVLPRGPGMNPPTPAPGT